LILGLSWPKLGLFRLKLTNGWVKRGIRVNGKIVAPFDLAGDRAIVGIMKKTGFGFAISKNSVTIAAFATKAGKSSAKSFAAGANYS
jgi:hypothetical protein